MNEGVIRSKRIRCIIQECLAVRYLERRGFWCLIRGVQILFRMVLFHVVLIHMVPFRRSLTCIT